MAPYNGHLMVPKAMRIVRFAITQVKSLVKTKAPAATATNTSIRAYTQKTIAIHPTALLKQSRTTPPQGHTRSFSSTPSPKSVGSGPKHNRSAFPTSRTVRAISQKGLTPYASTLRPNLTGGTLPRSSGGYSLGGTRNFSSTQACQAQAVQSVSAGIRAFFVGGSKARFDGVDPITGEKRWRAVTETQNAVYQKWDSPARSTKGTSLEFQLSPTITALLPASTDSNSCMEKETTTTLNTPTLLHTLSTDFARALHDLALTTADLNKLSAFGDLPISLHQGPAGPVLCVRFPGCDADAVSALCDEVGVKRGLILEDEAWVESRDAEMALLFPFAPSAVSDLGSERYYFQQRDASREGLDWRDMPFTPPDDESAFHYDSMVTTSPSPSPSPERYESLSEISYGGSSPLLTPQPRVGESGSRSVSSKAPTTTMAEQYEGVEGIYRFLREIEDARR